MFIKECIFSILAVVLMVLPVKASVDGEYFLSLGLGSSQFELNKPVLVNSYNFVTNASTFSDSSTSFGIAAGMKLDQYLSLEIDLVSAGDVTAREGDQVAKLFDVTGLAVTLALSKQVSESIAVIGRIGTHFWDISESFGALNTINSAVDLTYGVGMDINLYGDRSRQLRVQWNHYEYDGVFINSGDVFSLNILFWFGSGYH